MRKPPPIEEDDIEYMELAVLEDELSSALAETPELRRASGSSAERDEDEFDNRYLVPEHIKLNVYGDDDYAVPESEAEIVIPTPHFVHMEQRGKVARMQLNGPIHDWKTVCTICTIEYENFVQVGISVVSPKDAYDRRKGNEIALGRAKTQRRPKAGRGLAWTMSNGSSAYFVARVLSYIENTPNERCVKNAILAIYDEIEEAFSVMPSDAEAEVETIE